MLQPQEARDDSPSRLILLVQESKAQSSSIGHFPGQPRLDFLRLEHQATQKQLAECQIVIESRSA
jgi:hypothetical protein